MNCVQHLEQHGRLWSLTRKEGKTNLEKLSLALNACPKHPLAEPQTNGCDFSTGSQIATCGFLFCHQSTLAGQLPLILHYLLAKNKGHGPRSNFVYQICPLLSSMWCRVAGYSSGVPHGCWKCVRIWMTEFLPGCVGSTRGHLWLCWRVKRSSECHCLLCSSGMTFRGSESSPFFPKTKEHVLGE